MKDYIQFVTIRTQDSLDNYILKINNNKSLTTKKREYEIDKYLDNSSNGAYLFDGNIQILKDIIFSRDKIMYDLHAFSIMPNHLHIIFKQIDEVQDIIKYIKGNSARKLNNNIGKKGKFWASNYFDKLIRDEKHYQIAFNYVMNNPIKANLEDWESRVYSKYYDSSKSLD